MDQPGQDDRLAAFDRRLTYLERTVAELWLKVRATGAPAGGAAPAAPAALSAASAPPTPPAPPPREPRIPGLAKPRARPAVDLEQWLGAKGLLLVGVVALLLAAGFFLNYAFERGWIAPVVRVVGAVVAGAGVAVLGERQVRRGMRRFGLALVGAGGGLIYLGIWAAAGPYALVDRQIGIILIAATTVAVAWRALSHRAEPLVLWALLGALLAPLTLPVPNARPELFVAYLMIVGGAAGAVAHVFSWRITLAAALYGTTLLAGSAGFGGLHTAMGLTFLLVAGAGALAVSRKRGWTESRLGGVILPWLLLLAHGGMLPTADSLLRWTALSVGAALLLAEWAHDRTVEMLAREELQFEKTRDAAALEVAAFVLVPAAFVLLAEIASPAALGSLPGLPALAAAALYLAGGWRERRAPFVAACAALLAVAAGRVMEGPEVAAALSLLILLASYADRAADQRAGPGIAVIVGMFAFLQLFVIAASDRPHADRAFIGHWSAGLYSLVAGVAGAAWWWRVREGLPKWLRQGRGILWALAGVAVLLGVSLEIQHFFDLRGGAPPARRLASDLALSVWWLLFAGATVRLGFWLSNAAVRRSGLGVAGLAAVKIALFDLSRLEALYRVASFFVLALLALSVAFAYNRLAREPAGDQPERSKPTQ